MKNTYKNQLMMLSNIFLALPVIYAGIYREWLYYFLASGLLIFSPLYHIYKIKNPTSVCFKIFKRFDWCFAIGAFLYMYYYVYAYISGGYQFIFYTLLLFIILFFWYGYKKGDYIKTHPWFHIIAPIIYSIILVVSHIDR